MRNILLLITIFTVVTLTTGCGDGKLATINVSGTVTLDGVPLSGASVNFSPKTSEGHPAYGRTDENGRYKLQTFLGNPDAGTTPGEYLVSIMKTEEVDDSGSGDNTAPPRAPRSLVPERYTNTNTSGLTATVTKESTIFNFDLTR